MVPFSNAVKYRSMAACLVLIWVRTAPASACRLAWLSRWRAWARVTASVMRPGAWVQKSARAWRTAVSVSSAGRRAAAQPWVP
jgi:hypothetical protein